MKPADEVQMLRIVLLEKDKTIRVLQGNIADLRMTLSYPVSYPEQELTPAEKAAVMGVEIDHELDDIIDTLQLAD
jgi:hypothetical protein